MIISQLFTQINGAYRGSDDDAPTTGTDFNLWLGVTNRKQAEWCRDTKRNWQSLFSIDTLATTIAAGTQVYNLGATILTPSDTVTVTLGTKTWEFTVIKPEERANTTNAVYISGSNPQKLTFVDPIGASSPMLGGTITIGGYHLLPDYTAGSDTVLVDDPYWLVYAVASELAFNDITYADKAPDLNAKANNLYGVMVSNNRRGTAGSPRVTPTRVARIENPVGEYGVGNA